MKNIGFALFILALTAQTLAKNVPEEWKSPGDEILARGLSSKLQKFLEVDLRKIFKDPLYEPSRDFQFDDKLAKFRGILSDFHIHGLSAYNVNVAKVNIFKKQATIQLTFPKIISTGKYSANGLILQNNVYGDGVFNATLKDLKAHTVVSISIFPKLKANSVQLTISLGALQFQITGLFHSETISSRISQIISEQAPQLISKYHNEITATLSPILLKAINAAL